MDRVQNITTGITKSNDAALSTGVNTLLVPGIIYSTGENIAITSGYLLRDKYIYGVI